MGFDASKYRDRSNWPTILFKKKTSAPTPTPARTEPKPKPKPPKLRKIAYHPKEGAWGEPIAISAGLRRIPGWFIWIKGNAITPVKNKYYATFASSFGYPLIKDPTGRVVRRIWADGRLIYENGAGATSGALVGGGTWTFYPGSETQMPDPDHSADTGALTPAYRGQMYIVIKGLPLQPFLNEIPGISAEIVDGAYVGGQQMLVTDQIKLLARSISDFKPNDFVFEGMELFRNHGLMISDSFDFRDIIDTMARFYGFDYLESAGKLKFLRRSQNGIPASVGIIDEKVLLRDNDGPTITTSRISSELVPEIVQVTYIDWSQQFRENTQRARRAGFPVRSVRSGQSDSFSVPFIMSASDAMTGAARALYRDSSQKTLHQFRLPPSGLVYEPGDVVTVRARGKSYTVKIIEANIASDLSTDARAVTLDVNPDYAVNGYAGNITPPGAGQTLTTQFEFYLLELGTGHSISSLENANLTAPIPADNTVNIPTVEVV